MNKKGFTLIELIAVVVIMAIIAMIATPNIINMIDSGNKGKYVSDAKIFISKANSMYKLEKSSSSFDSEGRIKLEALEKPLATDPYGFKYELSESFVQIKVENGQKQIKIYLKSCEYNEKNEKTGKCHNIGTETSPELSTKLNEEKVN